MTTFQSPAATAFRNVTTSKRKTPTSESNLSTRKKRQRLSTDSDTAIDALREQQTLTQIEWAPSSRSLSFEDGENEADGLDMIEVGDGTTKTRQAKRSRSSEEGLRLQVGEGSHERSRLKKRNSTLTQMDFFNLEVPESDLAEGYLVHDAAATSNPEDIEQFTYTPRPCCTYEEPKKRRQKRTLVSVVQDKKHSISRDKDDHPANRSKVDLTYKKKTTRRSSDRTKTKVLSDPDPNLQYFTAALAGNSLPTPAVLQGTSQPMLEIQGPLNPVKDLENTEPTHVLSRASLAPMTPKKRKEVIPSSQSPESLPPSTRKKPMIDLVAPKRCPTRAPLREKSVNTPRTRRPVFDADAKKFSSQSTTSPSPKRKICILKLASKKVGFQNPRIADSQTDVWSIQPTSSPGSEKISACFGGVPAGQIDQTCHEEEIAETCHEEEIAETSQSVVDFEEIGVSSPMKQESLQSLPAILGTTRTKDHGETIMEFDSPLIQKTSRESEVLVRDFATENPNDVGPKPLDNPQVCASAHTAYSLTIANSIVEESDDEDINSLSGTPAANGELLHSVAVDGGQALLPSNPLNPPRCPKTNIMATRKEFVSEVRDSEDEDDDELEDSGSFPLPLPTLLEKSRTSTLPLNDIAPASSPSPQLPSMRNPTQRSVHPASLPRQSQISTQEATQYLLPMSSMPQFGTPEESQEPDRITIKDSSSIGVTLSQLPIHASEEEDDLDIDLDLDDYHRTRTIDIQPIEAQDGEEQEDMNDETEGDLDLDYRSVLSRSRHYPASISVAASHSRAGCNVEWNQPEDGSNSHEHDSQRLCPVPSQDQTQSNFTQCGHVTAARVARMKAQGLVPEDYVPTPDFRVPTDPRELLPAWAFEGLESDGD